MRNSIAQASREAPPVGLKCSEKLRKIERNEFGTVALYHQMIHRRKWELERLQQTEDQREMNLHGLRRNSFRITSLRIAFLVFPHSTGGEDLVVDEVHREQRRNSKEASHVDSSQCLELSLTTRMRFIKMFPWFEWRMQLSGQPSSN